MTTIKATCPDCGEVSLTPDEMALHVDSSGGGRSSYAFMCPDCGEDVRKPADERIVRLLLSGGVPVVEEASAPTLADRRFAGPAFTHDDLLDFHTLLESDAWFEVLLEVDRRHVA
ncbi:MAG TPA: hypothetical protein VNU01_03865 [Egibacteraceae bacterium]|nr:hypothetical protein [Egibacteraceae bacterium]